MSTPTPSEPDDEAPIVIRPRLARKVGYGVGVLLLGASIAIAILITTFDLPNRILFVLFGLGIFWFCHREASVHLTATREGVEVRNLMTRTRLEWAEIIGVSFPKGDPWAHLDLADGHTLAVMALQRSDGEHGLAQARHLVELIHDRGEAHPPSEPPQL
ncbi:PH domain-containing protein [Brachybacterium hainanense]|uniref:PH domain-containing protein n=1 Tax=Brachybacterium hainanense TaxID=1541174 RepID=A0ABV6RBB8_9MICO